MPRPSRYLLPCALVSLLAGSGCADEQEMFAIVSAAPLGEGCTVDDSGGVLLQDTLDVAIDAPFGLGLILENFQTQNANSNTNLVDDGELKLEYAEVRLTPENGAGSSFEVPLPTNSLPSGERAAVFVQVPASVTAELRGSVPAGSLQTLEMGVVIVADRTSQVANGKLGEVRSREFVFPFTLCNGCLSGCVSECGQATASACEFEETTDTDTGDTTTGP
jgi:hypothetical protein